jgi:hypothetical protein
MICNRTTNGFKYPIMSRYVNSGADVSRGTTATIVCDSNKPFTYLFAHFLIAFAAPGQLSISNSFSLLISNISSSFFEIFAVSDLHQLPMMCRCTEMSSALSQSTDVEQFALPIDVPVPQTQFSASLGLGLMHTSPQMVPGVTLTVRVLNSMQHPDIAAQLKWLQVDEAAAVYFLSPNLALCTHTRCLIINAADLASSGLSLSPAHSPRSNGPTPSEFALGSTSSTFSLAAAVSAAAAAAAAAAERGGLPTAESVGGGTLHPALVQLFTNDRIIKMGIDVTALLVDLFNSSDHVRGASFIELQNISSLTSSAALLSSDAPSLAADPLDTILQLLVCYFRFSVSAIPRLDSLFYHMLFADL